MFWINPQQCITKMEILAAVGTNSSDLHGKKINKMELCIFINNFLFSFIEIKSYGGKKCRSVKKTRD